MVDIAKSKKTRALIYLALAVVTLAVYWRATGFDFINYDDPVYVTQNNIVRAGLTFPGVVWAFTTFHGGNWHPLTWISHMLDCQFFGVNAGEAHLVNVFLHAANAVLLLLLLSRLTGAFWRSAIVAALFALHPLHVESVAWVAERKDVLSTFFGLLALLSYASYVNNSKLETQNPKRPFIWVTVCFALSLLAKPMLVTLPFLMLVLDLWPLRRFEIVSWQTLLAPPFRRLVLEKKWWFALAVASSFVTYFAQKAGGAVASVQHFPFYMRIENPIRSYFLYIVKACWPVHLAVFYPLDFSPHVLSTMAIAALLAVVTLAAVGLVKRAPYFLTGWLWFLGTLVPVIGFVQVGNQALADRYTYIPLTGLFIAVVWGISELLRRVKIGIIIGTAATLTALGLCAGLTVAQLQYWQNSLTLFTHALAVTGDHNDAAHNNLGTELARLGRKKEAVEHYQKAVQFDPGNVHYQNNLGTALLREGDRAGAEEHYLHAIQDDPGFAEAYSNLGSLYLSEHQFAAALTNLTEAVRLDPNDGETRNNLANALSASGNLTEALKQYSEAIRLSPNDPTVRLNTGLALLKTGQTNDAVAQFTEAVRLNPSSAQARYELGRQLFFQGQFPAALEQLAEANKLHPADPFNEFYLSAALAQTGRFDDATAIASEALAAAQRSGQTSLAARIEQALEFYKGHRPLLQKRGETNQ